MMKKPLKRLRHTLIKYKAKYVGTDVNSISLCSSNSPHIPSEHPTANKF